MPPLILSRDEKPDLKPRWDIYYDPPPTTEDKDETSNILGDDGEFVDAAPFSIGDYLYEAGEYLIQNDSPHVNTNANETVFSIGDTVRIKGLVSAPQFNDMRGIVVSELDRTTKWT